MYHKYDKHNCIHSFLRMHYCLVPVTLYLVIIFDSIRKSGILPGNVRAVDMQNILLLLPLLLHNLLEEEVEEYNSQNPCSAVVSGICWLLCTANRHHKN